MNKNDRLVEGIKQYSSQIGGYAGEYTVPYSKYWYSNEKSNNKVVASCDGVGTKILLAQHAKKKFGRSLKTIGIDCVAMVVNDLLCSGCDPLFFLDYFCSESVNEEDFNEVLEGIHVGCELAGMELIGGETAELPGIIKNGAFDVCGFGVGRVTDKLPMPDTMKAGDKIVGLASSGFHSNGYTLIRQHMRLHLEANIEEYRDALDEKDFIYSLLEPTIIYNSEIDALIKEGIEIKGLAHITGDGYNNVNRVLPNHLSANISLWDPEQTGNASNETRFFRHEKLFQWIQKEAKLTKKEMMATFNCGVGMVVIVPDDSDWIHLGHVLKDHLILGELEEKWDG
jgi:phosphoribosylformylglycinamidine cyclo-ligase